MNFSFWHAENETKFGVFYNGQLYTGYMSLCAVICRAIDADIPILSPQSWSDLNWPDIFKSDTETSIPLLQERILVLKETSKSLIEHFNGDFKNCLLLADHSAETLIELLLKYFPSFCDACYYKDEKVCFYKRAQILVADIWACFDAKDLGYFHDIDQITMFADYRVPQSLAFFGVLKYSPQLQLLLQKGDLLPHGHPLEVEIRGCSIWAVESILRLIKTKYHGNSRDLNAIILDFYLWDYAKLKEESLTHIPIHHTRSIYY